MSGGKNIVDVLYGILCTSEFLPLMQLCAFLLVRLHVLSAELATTLTRATFLMTAAETGFSEIAHSTVQVCMFVLPVMTGWLATVRLYDQGLRVPARFRCRC